MTGMQYYPFIYTNGGFRQVTAYIGKNSEESNSFVTANNLVFSTKDNLIFVPRDAATKMMRNNSNEVNI